MIIVSQDKRDIVNFNKVVVITIQHHEEYVPDKGYVILAEISFNKNIELGYYEEKGRAKEVLQAIIEKYENCNWRGSGFVANGVFYVPKE